MLEVLMILLIITSLGGAIWAGVGQYIAQINYDGVYYTWRIIPDISMLGLLIMVISFVLLLICIYKYNQR